MEALQNVKTWLLQQGSVPTNSTEKLIKEPGYTALFTGTGANKIATAETLGKEAGKEVHHVNLSQIVSKYIGETEKNIDALFSKAAQANWILFFDEADALFGKRTEVKDAHDKYANLEVSYLLQQIEHYSGLVILAVNHKENIDPSFIRRFQTVVHFPLH